ncbi:MAG: molecular chaperone HtpG [Bacteroidales bacterium]|jgi:molecular chaperone HtpG
MKETGKINVQTENIFPIIKKFLYTDQEIFLREIISNAVDATQKIKTLANIGNFKGELGDLSITVTLDKENKTITVSDNGIGMTKDEVIKYITDIAFSGAEDFVSKFKNKTKDESSSMIGHFGLGFYSAFMVAEKVEIETKTYKKGGQTKPVHWECTGETDYIIGEGTREKRGTDIIMHISDDASEYLDDYTIYTLLKKYCRFLPIPIIFGTEIIREEIEGEKDDDGNPKYKDITVPRVINNTNPLWKQTPTSLKDEDYNNFYRELYPSVFEDPLFHIHLNVDYPFNLTGILYFPKVTQNIELQREKIQLYSNQVFVTDNVEGVVPDFLTLLHGVIDSPDIPLNVSRSSLQSDSNVKKISNYILKKVSDKLEEISKKDPKAFEEKWDNIKVFIEYGMISEPDFYDKAIKYALFKNDKNQYFTFDEYIKEIKDIQKDKDDKTVIIYSTNLEDQFSYIDGAKELSYDILVMDQLIDSYFINTLEQNNENVHFVRVDSDVPSKLIDKGDTPPSKLNEEEKTFVKGIFEELVDKAQYTVETEDLSEDDLPILITRNEFLRRMNDMSKLGGGYAYMNNFPDSYALKLNVNHPIITNMLNNKDDKEKNKQIAEQLIDLAKLQQNLLTGEKLSIFIHRSLSLIK